MKKPKLIIAGPGGGKTHDLVDEIIGCITQLQPYRILAAITYTNAATASIKSRLEKKIKLPPNVFIGTTYSFFNAFILLPFASLFGLVELDKLFVEYDIERIAEEATKKHSKKIPFADPGERKRYKNGVEANHIKRLLEKGVVPFEQIAKISLKLMEDKNVKLLVAERLQFLFIDEFQDATSYQYKIFEHIRKAKKTTMYAVGDPEQYISNYTIKRTKPHFSKLPIITFKTKSEVVLQKTNKRSSKSITTFINNFNTQLQQKSERPGIQTTGVYFINKIKLDAIVAEFRKLSKEVENIKDFRRFYLAYTNAAFNVVSTKYNLILASNESLRPHSKLSEALKIICDAVQLSPKKFCEQHKLDSIEYRVLGIRLLKSSIISETELETFLKSDLKLTVSEDADMSSLFKAFHTIKNESSETISSELTSSIHKAKGLEADAVLVVARTNKELNKWLETEKNTRFKDKTDDHRLGFVAFSRAKEILCIACMEEIDSVNKKKMDSLHVTTSNDQSEQFRMNI